MTKLSWEIDYSNKFDQIRKDMVCVSYFKYGPAKKNFAEGRVDTIKSLERKLQRYKETGNTEFLADVANYAMFEFMYPQKKGAFYKPTDVDNESKPVGTPINLER